MNEIEANRRIKEAEHNMNNQARIAGKYAVENEELAADLSDTRRRLAEVEKERDYIRKDYESTAEVSAQLAKDALKLDKQLTALRNAADGLRDAASVAGGKIAMAVELYADVDLRRVQIRKANANLNKSLGAYAALIAEGVRS